MNKKYKSTDKIILSDCDGVMCNWEFAFAIWMVDHGYEEIEDAHYHYSMAMRFNLPDLAIRQLVTVFNESAAIGFLPSLRDSIQYVKKLHEEQGYVFHVITSLSKDPNAQALREINLKKLFGDTAFTKFKYLDTAAEKTSALEEYRDSGLWWIEDKVENADLGHEMGLRSLLMEHGHSIEYNGPATVVTKWEEIYGIITDENTP
jgi:hypothetical protein